MAHQKVKSSIYLNKDLHRRVKALSSATSISLNTYVALALEEYLRDKARSATIEEELASSRQPHRQSPRK